MFALLAVYSDMSINAKHFRSCSKIIDFRHARFANLAHHLTARLRLLIHYCFYWNILEAKFSWHKKIAKQFSVAAKSLDFVGSKNFAETIFCERSERIEFVLRLMSFTIFDKGLITISETHSALTNRERQKF